jgi:hypothetical protein
LRIHTTAVPATKYLPTRIHVKFTDDNNVPNNITDRTFQMDNDADRHHTMAVTKFLEFHNMSGTIIDVLGPTLTKQGFVYQIVED